MYYLRRHLTKHSNKGEINVPVVEQPPTDPLMMNCDVISLTDDESDDQTTTEVLE